MKKVVKDKTYPSVLFLVFASSLDRCVKKLSLSLEVTRWIADMQIFTIPMFQGPKGGKKKTAKKGLTAGKAAAKGDLDDMEGYDEYDDFMQQELCCKTTPCLKAVCGLNYLSDCSSDQPMFVALDEDCHFPLTCLQPMLSCCVPVGWLVWQALGWDEVACVFILSRKSSYFYVLVKYCF